MVWLIKKNIHSHLMGIYVMWVLTPWHKYEKLQFPPSQAHCCVSFLPATTRGSSFSCRVCTEVLTTPGFRSWWYPPEGISGVEATFHCLATNVGHSATFKLSDIHWRCTEWTKRQRVKDLGSRYIIFDVSPLLFKVWDCLYCTLQSFWCL